jgi:23S rRNA (cytosine1962-C5)-methyltransferase
MLAIHVKPGRVSIVREPAIPTVVVNARGRARIASGHPWVYRQDVLSGPTTDARTGGPALVAVLDQRRRTLASATWATLSPVALRILQRRSENGPLPELMSLVTERLQAALAWRQQLALDRDALRLVHGEADGLPGLFVDRYADAAVVQTTSVAMDAARPALAALLKNRLDVRIVVARDDGSARDFEGLPRVREVAAGSGATEVVYRLGENRLQADLLTDSKTGGFLDQADNHAVVAALAPLGARCLDAFTYHGGFALALARRQGPVLATDEDAQAVARAQANAARNQLPNLEVRQANAFELLRTLEADKQRFDVVVLDPPALAKRQAGDHAALRAYQEIVLRGLRLTGPGGLAVACSCSGRVSRAQFDELASAAAAQSGRSIQILERRGAGRDHPELAGVPETGHLKCWILRVL